MVKQHLFSYKSDVTVPDGLTLEEFGRLNESDFKAFNYEFAGDHIFFDPDYYLANNGDVAASGLNPFTHAMEFGINEGRSPNALWNKDGRHIVVSAKLSPGIFADSQNPNNPNDLIALSIFDPVGDWFNKYVLQPIGGAIFGGLIIKSVETFNEIKNAWEFVIEEGTPAIPFLSIQDDSGVTPVFPLSIPDHGFIPGTLPFPIPPEEEIKVDVFNGDINFQEVKDGSLFTFPDESELEYTGVLTTPKGIGSLDDIVNGPFVFPDKDDILQGTYVLESTNDSSLPISVGTSSSLGIAEVDNYVSTLETVSTPTSKPANLFEIEQTGRLNYRVPTGNGSETFNIDGFQGRVIVDAKFTANLDRSLYILNSKAPQWLKDKTLRQEESQFRRIKDIIDNPQIPFESLEVRVNDARIVPYFESLIQQFGIPGEVNVVPTQVP